MSERSWVQECKGTIACLLLIPLLDLHPQLAYGGSTLVSGDAASIFIRMESDVTGRVLIGEIASHLGIRVRGDAGQGLVGRSQLEGVPLSVAVSRLFPHSSFSIRYSGDDTAPEEIVFAHPLPSEAEFSVSVAPTASIDTTNRAGVAIPTANRAEFIGSIPMLKKD